MNDQAISKSARSCEALFNSLRTAPCPDASSAKKAESLLQNFYVWTSFLGVFAPETASLDRRLRDAQDVRDLVLQLLSLMSDSLAWAISHQNDGGHEWGRQLDGSLGSVRKAMDRLELLGKLIRQSSMSSLERRVQKFSAKHRDVHSERFMLNLLENLYRHAPASLRQQVNNSISHSRYRLSYIRDHQEKLANSPGREDVDVKVSKATSADKADVLRAKTVTFDEDPARLVAEENATPRRDVPVPPRSHTDASTFNKPEKFNFDVTKDPISASYARSTVTFVLESLDNYPPVPSHEDGTKVLCRYCTQPLAQYELTKRGWRRHWEDDLRPYVCMSEDCHDPKSFSRIQEWRTHMSQHSFNWVSKVHAEKHWACDIDYDVFYDEVEFRRHLNDTHGGLYDTSELDVIAKMSLETHRRDPSVCPLCTASLQPTARVQDRPGKFTATETDPEDQKPDLYEAMLGHIEGHLRHLALKSWDLIELNNVGAGVDGQMPSKTDTPVPSNASNVHQALQDLKSQFSTTNLEQSGPVSSTWLDPEYEKMEITIEPPVEDVDWNGVYAIFSPGRLLPSGAETLEEGSLPERNQNKEAENTAAPQPSVANRDWDSTYRGRPSRREEFSVALICTLPIEFDAVALTFDETWEGNELGKAPGDFNHYTLGRLGNQNAVLVLMPSMGKVSAASATTILRHSFPSVNLAFLCGICGGVPNPSPDIEILLGDVIIGDNVVQYDYGRQYASSFIRKDIVTDFSGMPVKEIRSFLAGLETNFGRDELREQISIISERIQREAVESGYRSKFLRSSIETDVLFRGDYLHRHRYTPDCSCSENYACDEAIYASCADLQCDPEYHVLRRRLNGQIKDNSGSETTQDILASTPQVFVGTVGSGDTVLKSGEHRDRMAQQHGIIAFDGIGGAGVWNEIPCIIVKSVCDYADGHRDKKWQSFAAVTAACATKAVLNMYNFATVPTATTHVSHTTETPDPAFIVPYNENPDFVGRSEILERVKDLFGHSDAYHRPGNEPHSRVALHGLGGVGKTQIALAYSYWFKERFPDTSVFWINTSNVEWAQKAFSDIARECKIPGHKDTEVNVFSLVKGWLENKRRARWLLVIDSADDTEVFFPAAGRQTTSLGHLLPECPHGSVLITTRNKQAGRVLTRGNPIIQVQEMTQTETTQLVRTLLEDESVTPAEASLLSSRLDHLPLALTQAASFILENSISIRDYSGFLDESNSGMIDRLSEPLKAIGRDTETPHSLTATWAISFNLIQQQKPIASNVLYLMSFFDRQAIPKQFIWDYCRETLQKSSHLASSSELQEDFEDDLQINTELEVTQTLGLLQAFSFISTRVDHLFEMHRLVQLVTQKQLADRGAMSDFATSALRIVRKAFPQSTYKSRLLCLQLLPHALAVLEHAEAAGEEPLQEQAELSRDVGWYFREREQYEASEKLLLRAFRSYCKVSGPEAEDTLVVMRDLTNLYIDMDRADEALEMATGVLEIDEKLQPEDKDLILRDKALVGSALTQLRRFEEAEPLCLEILAQRKEMEGEEHSSTLDAYESVAHIYYQTGRLREAQKLCIELVELTEKILGKDDPITLKRVSSLSRTHRKLGYYEDAEKLALRVTNTRARLLGDSHPRTISSLRGLLQLYHEMGRSEEEAKVRLRLAEAEKDGLE